MNDPDRTTADLLVQRFGDTDGNRFGGPESDLFAGLAARSSCRSYDRRPVDPDLLRTLCALALCSPTKSDLQQRDIVIVTDRELRGELDALLSDFEWVATAPSLLVFCGNNRRQRQVHEMRGHRFANDHLDAFFNAAVDAGIALSAFVIAAESVGLGCCPLSAIRNHGQRVSELLGLPDHVFPVAGLALGYPGPGHGGQISMRLPVDVTVHHDRFDESTTASSIADYDLRRAGQQPYPEQRASKTFGTVEPYTWSEDKARQYALPERQDFGRFVRSKGFRLD